MLLCGLTKPDSMPKNAARNATVVSVVFRIASMCFFLLMLLQKWFPELPLD